MKRKLMFFGILFVLVFIISLLSVSGEFQQFTLSKQLGDDNVNSVASHNYSFTDTYQENNLGKWENTFLYTVDEISSKKLDNRTLYVTFNISRTDFGDWVVMNSKSFGFFSKNKLAEMFSSQDNFKHKTSGKDLSLNDSENLIDDIKHLNVYSYDGDSILVLDNNLNLGRQKSKVVNLQISLLNSSEDKVNLKFGHSSINFTMVANLGLTSTGVIPLSQIVLSPDRRYVVRFNGFSTTQFNVTLSVNNGTNWGFIGNYTSSTSGTSIPSFITSSVYSPNGNWIALEGIESAAPPYRGSTIIFNGTNFNYMRKLTHSYASGNTYGSAFSQDNKFLASCIQNGVFINVWNTTDWSLFKTYEASCKGISFSKSNLFAFIYSSFDGSYYYNASLNIYNTTNWVNILNITLPSGSLSYNKGAVEFSPDNKFLAVEINNGSINIYNTTNWNLINTITPIYGLQDKGIKFSPDSRFVVLANAQNITFYNTTNWGLADNFNLSYLPPVENSSSFSSIDFSLDNQSFAVNNYLSTAHILAQAAFIYTYSNNSNNCIPPSVGNWVINETCNIVGGVYTITQGNLSIKDHGILNLSGSSNISFATAKSYIRISKGGKILLRGKSKFG